MNKISFVLAALLCVTVTGCGSEKGDTTSRKTGVPRTVLPRVGEAEWQPCRRIPGSEIVPDVQCGAPIPSCPPRITSHKDAHTFLGRCPGEVIEYLQRIARASARARSDLAAAYYVRAQKERRAVDLFHALHAADAAVAADGNLAAAHYNRALIQEAIGLEEEAIVSLVRVQRLERDAQWAAEALRRQNALIRRVRNAAHVQWPRVQERLRAARDEGEVLALIRAYPYAAQMFAETVLLREWATTGSRQSLNLARLIGRALQRRSGDRYLVDVVAAIDGADLETLKTLRKAHETFSEAVYQDDIAERETGRQLSRSAEKLFEQAGSAAKYHAKARVADDDDALPYPVLNVVRRMRRTQSQYIERNQYVKAAEEYKKLVELATGIHQPELQVSIESRYASTLWTLGQTELALTAGLRALQRMDRIASAPERTAVLSNPVWLAEELAFPNIARRWHDVHIATLQTELVESATDVRRTSVITRSLGRAMRARARDHVLAGDYEKAKRDLEEARSLMPAGAIADRDSRDILQMQWLHVLGDAELRSDPAAALRTFTAALELTEPGKYRATRAALFLRRAEAYRELRRIAEAERDVGAALRELEADEKDILANRKRGETEWVWSRFLSRSRGVYEQLVRYAMDDRPEVAFSYAERARAFEPLMLILQYGGDVPEAFLSLVRKGREVARADIQKKLLPGTFLIEYMVMNDRTLVWIVSRDGLVMRELPIARKEIEAYIETIEEAVRVWRGDRLLPVLEDAYRRLVETPLAEIKRTYSAEPRLVFIADGAMHGLPFGALRNRETGRHLIQDAVVENAGSATLYVHSLVRDGALPRVQRPSVLLLLDPEFDPDLDVARGAKPLPFARGEERSIGDQYPLSTALIGAEATVERFLSEARRHTVIQFSGHGRPNAQTPIHSLLLFAPSKSPQHDGVLEADELLTRLELDATRLVILAACSSAGGAPVGPEGVAPLVRPLVAAGVPAVIGTLWNVDDQDASRLLVRFHEHYRLGNKDAASALRDAQLDLLRGEESLLAWVPFQVVGHASSPFAPTNPPKPQRSH